MSRFVLIFAVLAVASLFSATTFAAPNPRFEAKIYCAEPGSTSYSNTVKIQVGTIYGGDVVRVIISEPHGRATPVVMLHDMNPQPENGSGVYQNAAFRLMIATVKGKNVDEYPAKVEFLYNARVRNTVELVCKYF